MKKTITLLSIILIIAFAPEKEYKLTEGQAVMIYQQAELLQSVLPQSELPAKTATQYIMQADSIKKVIALQYQKFNVDTTKKK